MLFLQVLVLERKILNFFSQMTIYHKSVDKSSPFKNHEFNPAEND